MGLNGLDQAHLGVPPTPLASLHPCLFPGGCLMLWVRAVLLAFSAGVVMLCRLVLGSSCCSWLPDLGGQAAAAVRHSSGALLGAYPVMWRTLLLWPWEMSSLGAQFQVFSVLCFTQTRLILALLCLCSGSGFTYFWLCIGLTRIFCGSS